MAVRAVVAGGAGTDDVGVIDAGDRDPAAGAVAVLADRVGLDMGGVLAGGVGAVVAADAVAADVGCGRTRRRSSRWWYGSRRNCCCSEYGWPTCRLPSCRCGRMSRYR